MLASENLITSSFARSLPRPAGACSGSARGSHRQARPVRHPKARSTAESTTFIFTDSRNSSGLASLEFSKISPKAEVGKRGQHPNDHGPSQVEQPCEPRANSRLISEARGAGCAKATSSSGADTEAVPHADLESRQIDKACRPRRTMSASGRRRPPLRLPTSLTHLSEQPRPSPLRAAALFSGWNGAARVKPKEVRVGRN